MNELTLPQVGSISQLQQEQLGYKQTLNRRHIQMIAIGGAIGTGLFLGSANLLHMTGPALIISYALAGFLALLLMLALGELVLHRPTSGAFVSYAREFFGESVGFLLGWLYWLKWPVSGVTDLSAVGLYLKDSFHGATWPGALLGCIIVVSLNIISARAFAEFEFWASILKVGAIIVFLITAVILVICQVKLGDQHAGIHNLHSGAGFWPHTHGHNWFFPIFILNSVLFAYIGIEFIAFAAGEMQYPEKEIPRAIKSVIVRIVIFYVGSIFLLVCLLPTSEYIRDTSPFVTLVQKFNNPFLSRYIPAVLTTILIIAALSSLNSALYVAGRILQNLAFHKQAPRFVLKLNRSGVPMSAVLFTAAVFSLGVILDYILDRYSHNPLFDIAQQTGSLIIICVWSSVFACQLRLRYLSNRGLVPISKFRTPFSPFLGIFGIISLLSIGVFCVWGGNSTNITLGTSYHFSTSQLALLTLPLIAIGLIIGWLKVRPKSVEPEKFLHN